MYSGRPILAGTIAGASITNAYWSTYEDLAPPGWTTTKVALGGLTAPMFNGEIPKPAQPLHDYTQDVIDDTPDGVVLMLGANDSFEDWANAPVHTHFPTYIASMTSIFDRLDAAGIKVIVGVPTPLVDDPGTKVANGEINLAAHYRPWLKSMSSERGYLILDFNAIFLSIPGWEALQLDGVHPTAAGEVVLASAAISALGYMPPSGVLKLKGGPLKLQGTLTIQ